MPPAISENLNLLNSLKLKNYINILTTNSYIYIYEYYNLYYK